MNLFGVGSGELIFILVIALLVMGPERLPQIARQWAKFSKMLSRVTRVWQQINSEINRELALEEQRPARSTRPASASPALPADPESADEVEPTIAPPAPAASISQAPADDADFCPAALLPSPAEEQAQP